MGNRDIKRIGILTSGGDCPGLNAAIRAAVNHASLTYGWEVVGIAYGTQGLRDRPPKAINLTVHGMNIRGIDPLLSFGGTILGSVNKGDPFDGAVLEGYHELGLDALVAIGGDGSLRILHQLAREGNWNLVAIPKTIDNDVAMTNRSIGFDTAVNTVTEALFRLTSTAASHDRVMVVEVMGRTAGHLALHAGIAGGADVILIPEIPYSIDNLYRKLAELHDRWQRRFAIVVVAEGARTAEGEMLIQENGKERFEMPRLGGMGQYIADQLSHYKGDRALETRVTVLGHIQRGGIPTALDRLMATAMGKNAVDLVAQGKFNHMVGWRASQVVTVPIEDVFNNSPALVDPHGFLVRTAHALGIYIGELAPDITSLPMATVAKV